MSTPSTPDFGDTISRIGDFVRYPRRVMLQMLRSALSSEYLFTDTDGHRVPNEYRYEADAEGQTTKESRI